MDTMEEYRKATERANQIIWTAERDKREYAIFLQDVEQWKSNARHAETELAKQFGYVLPDKPKPKPQPVFNPQKFEEFWQRVHREGERLPDDFFIDFIPRQLSEDFWLLWPKPKPVPVNTGKPIGAKDPAFGKGWFSLTPGSVKADGTPYKAGDTWTDPDTDLEYELHEFEPSPFNPGYVPLKWGIVGIAKRPA
jgi:hypothetical protein